ADIFTGEPGFSAPLYESDYAPHKPRCDVLLHGSAYAPGGKPVRRVRVSLQVGSMSKSFDVVGNRVWKKRLFFVRASKPDPFTVMPISYNNAFGGVDNTHKEEKKHRTYLTNHVGVGFYTNLKVKVVHNKPLPNTEEPSKHIKRPHRKYVPMSFGPIVRSHPTRLNYAGTYDADWLENIFPFLPEDCDPRYYQCAPEDQQMDYSAGGERVELVNLTPGGRTVFELPCIAPPVEFVGATFAETKQPVCDTVILEPDERRLLLVCRTSLPLKRNLFEVQQVIVGRMSPGWYRAREVNKEYYRSLGDLTRSRKELL